MRARLGPLLRQRPAFTLLEAHQAWPEAWCRSACSSSSPPSPEGGSSSVPKGRRETSTPGRSNWRRSLRRGVGCKSCDDQRDNGFDPNPVFKVFATHSEPYYTMPWTMSPQTSSAASAFALNMGTDRFLLTNAHAVHHASLVELQRPGEDTKFLANVICQGPECDLALLEVPEEAAEAFWEGVAPLELCKDLPFLNDRVQVCGYPIGGENASVTQGVVSRVDLQPYRHGTCNLLAIQIDAAINPGNSGGPVLDGCQRCVGVAFQSLRDGETENIGYVIPAEVIVHFLEGYRRFRRYAGFGHHGFSWQPLDNKALRDAIGAEGGAGVLIKKVEPTAPAAKLLQARDVLLSIGGRTIGGGGTVHFRRRERIAFPYVTSRLCPGDRVEVEILRAGQVQKMQLELTWPEPLVPMHPPQPPAYIVFGGLVFVPLSEPYLRSEWGEIFEDRAPLPLVEPWLKNVRRFRGEEVVVLSSVFATPLTAGLTHLANRRLHKCDGQEVRNLQHLAELLDGGQGSFILLELDEDDIIALPRSSVLAVNKQVLESNLIPAARRFPVSDSRPNADVSPVQR